MYPTSNLIEKKTSLFPVEWNNGSEQLALQCLDFIKHQKLNDENQSLLQRVIIYLMGSEWYLTHRWA